MFYDIFAELCVRKGVSPSHAAVDMGFYRSSVSYWKNKAGSPGKDGILKMSEYFGVPADYLTGGTEKTEPAVLGKTDEAEIDDFSIDEPFEEQPPGEPIGPAKLTEPGFQQHLAKALEYIESDPSYRHMGFSEKIKSLRKQQGLTVDYVAKAVDVDKKTIQMWENGNTSGIRRYKIGKLAKALNTTVDCLFDREELLPERASSPYYYDMDRFVEMLRTRGECIALMLLAREASREDIELTISFMRSLIAAGRNASGNQ